MSRVIQNVASVRYEINARPASASMRALEEEAKTLKDAMAGVDKKIAELGNVAPDDKRLIDFRQQLKGLKSDLDDVNRTMKDYTRGVKAADELLKAAETGTIESLSMKAIKAGANGLRKRIENIKPNTLSPEDQQSYRIIEQVIDEADNVVNKFKTDAAETIQILRDGGTVSEKAMRQARDGVKSLMESYEEGSKENREFAQQYEYLAAKVSEYADNMRRAKGDIVDHNDARRAAVRLTKEGAEAAAKEREMQDAVIAGMKQEIQDTQYLRQLKEKEIDQTYTQMATNMRLADAAMAERRQMEDDYQASLGAIAAEKRQQAQQQAQAAHDEADQMRANAQIAQQTAQQKRQAYEQETQTVTQLDGEVKKLTEDIKAMSAEPVKPKVDTSEIEKLNAELKEAQRVLGNASAFEKLAQAKLEGMRSAHATQEAGFRSKEAELRKFTDATYELQERRNELDWAIEPFSRKGRNRGQYHFDIHDIEQQRVAVEKLDEAFRRLHDDEYFKNAPLSRQYELLGTSAFGYSDAEQQFGSYERAIRSLGVALEETGAKARLVFQGAGVDKSFQGVEFMEGYVTRRKEIAQLNSEIKKALGDTDIDALAREVETERRIFNEGTEALQEQEREVERWGKLKQEYADKAAEAERKYSEAQQQAQQQSATTSDELQRKQAELAAKTDELAQAKQRQAKAQGEMNTAEQQAAKAQDDANQKQVEAIQLGEKAAQANDEAAKAEESHNAVLQRQDEKIAKLQNDYDALDDTLRKQEGELAAYDEKVAQSEQTIAEAERKKAQARELSAKDMRDAIAALRERNDAIGEANPEWEKNERLIAQYNQRLEEMKQRSAELRGEVMSLSDALGMAGTIDGGGASVEKMEQAIKTLTEAKRKATDQKDFDEYGAAIDKISQKLKEATSEWMSLSRAEEIARQAGENYYLDNSKKGFYASPEEIQKATAALNRQRETLIKTIQAKKANKEATDAEEKELADLTKKLRDLKFEQDNVNMSQEKMRMLMKQPAQAVSLDELRAAIKRADGELRRMEGSLGKNSKEYKAFAEQVKAAKNTLKDMEGAAKASASAWEKAVSRLKTYVGLYMGFNIFWQKVTGTAGDLLTLSDKMGEVRKTTQMTADQVGRLSDALTKLDTRTSLTGLMEFSSLAGSIGLKTQEDVQGFTEAANMLSVSLPELGSEASRTLMKIADATGDLEKNGNNVRETLERVGSTVIALRANSAAAAGPITDFVSRVGAVGAQAGISIDQIAALGATVDALGGRVEMSATALSRMIPAIRNNTFEVAQAIGMTEKQLKSMSGIDQMVAVFKALRDSVKNFDMTTEEGMNAAADAVEGMLGRSVSMQDVMKQLNQQGARAGIVFGLLSQNVDTLEKQLKTAGEAYKDNTALMEEYNKMNDTAAAKWERLKNTIEEWFVSDKMQRILGDLIDIVRKFADWFAADGPLATGFKMMIAYAMAMKVEFGAAFMGIGGGLKAIGTAFGSFVNVLATGATAAVGNLAGMTKGLRGLRMATIGARREWLKMDAAMKANVIGAVITAIGLLVYKLYDMHRASKEAAAEVGRFNQKIADERKALNSLFEPLNKSNTAQDQRLKLINEINSKYGKYLGYMLSETSSAIALADAHALIAKRIREEAYEKRLLEQENKIKGEHEEDMSSRYGWIVEQAREGARGNADATAIADAIKSYIDKNLGNVENDFYFGSLRRSNESVKKLENGLNNVLERMVVDGKLTRDGAENLQKVAMQYLDVAKATEVDIEKHTSNLRSDLRGIQGAIQTDLANNLNNLVNNVINSANNIVRQMPGPVSQYLGRPEEQKGGLPSLFGGSQQGGTSWKAPWQQQQQTTPKVQKAPEGWKPNINKKDPAAVRQLVQDQDALRSGLQGYTGPNREAYESWLIPDKDLAEYRKLMQQQSRTNGGGGGGNIYGDYNKVTSPYKEWNGNDLVARRKEMLERVKALANGANVQAVLSEDAKFISDAVRKNIKTTEQAIEWYNTERLKIQDALHAKHLTNTGDWLDPKKGAKRASRLVQDEMKYYLDELDAYYTERKQKIEEARSNEEITEGEAWRRNLKNENEWYQRRAELLKLYANKSSEVTEKEQDAIFDIISERTGETTAYIKQDIGQTVKFINDVGTKSKAAMDRILGDIDLKTEQARLKSQQAITKQVKFIEETLAKERPYDGITKNLQDNLDKMGVLAARMRRVNDELTAEGKEPKFSNAEITAQSYKEMAFYLKQAGEAYSIDVNTLLRRMAEEGMAETAKEIEQSDMLKQAVMGQLRKTYQEVQDAIKKEASQIKKDVEILWNDETLGPDGRSIKATFDKAIAQLGMQQDSVSRANSLIGAGTASDNVATRLAMKQIEVQMRMQKAQFDMFRNQANQRMAALKAEAKEHERIADLAKKEGDYAEEARERTKATNALRDAENVKRSLGLTLAEETKKEEEQKAELLKLQEESQNRLYQSLREWADLLTSSIQGVFEASHAGDAEYYNERAKLDLTGKGGPGAGTYVVIDDAGTSDATAHYEYLDERQALERQHEIEQQNAQAEAWKKLWDDINMKMTEQITDWINAAAQNASVDANTDATLANTEAIVGLTAAMGGKVDTSLASGLGYEPSGNEPNQTIERIGYEAEQQVAQTETTDSAPSVFLDPNNVGLIWEQQAEAAELSAERQVGAIDKVKVALDDQFHKQTQGSKESSQKMTSSTQSAFAKMTAAANLYGIAYQAMSNDNLSAAQKFSMMAIQAAGQSAITALTVDFSKTAADATMNSASVLGKLWSQLGWGAVPVYAIFTGLLGGLMGLAASKVAKSKSEIAQATGTSVGAGRLATGMLTYAEGNVNEFTDPASLTPGRQYNVDGADGKTYRARYMGKDAKTHITHGPEFHLVGEKGREAIIDAHTTRLMQTDDTGIWQAIQTLYNGGRVSGFSTRRGRGVRAFAEGNIGDFEEMTDGGYDIATDSGGGGLGFDPAALQASLDRNSDVQEALLERLQHPLTVAGTGSNGVVAMYDKLKKEAQRQGVKYI